MNLDDPSHLKRYRLAWQFSLKSLLITVTVVSAIFAVFTFAIRNQRRMVTLITASGGKVVFKTDGTNIRTPGESSFTSEPSAVFFSKATITEEIIAAIAELPRLERLDLCDCNIRPDAMKRLSTLRNIIRLRLSGTTLQDDDLLPISSLTQLRELDLTGTSLTDRALPHLQTLQNLGILAIDDTAITDDGVSRLGELKNLYELDLSRTAVTDLGVARLSNIRSLIELSLYGTTVSSNAIAKLRNALPDLRNVQGVAVTSRK